MAVQVKTLTSQKAEQVPGYICMPGDEGQDTADKDLNESGTQRIRRESSMIPTRSDGTSALVQINRGEMAVALKSSTFKI
jgi:hypothetical protein